MFENHSFFVFLSCSRHLFPSRSYHNGKSLCLKFCIYHFLLIIQPRILDASSSLKQLKIKQLLKSIHALPRCSLSRFTKSKISSLPHEGRMLNVSDDLLAHVLIKKSCRWQSSILNNLQNTCTLCRYLHICFKLKGSSQPSLWKSCCL